jgi:hypothetical protein
MPSFRSLCLFSCLLFWTLLSPGAGKLAQAQDDKGSGSQLGPIVLSETATTEAQCRPLRLAFWANELNQYRKQTTDPPATRDAAEEFLKVSLHVRTNQLDTESKQVSRKKELPELGRRAVEQLKSKDPIILSHHAYWLWQTGKLSQALTQVEAALQGFAKSNYPGGLKFPALVTAFHLSHRLDRPDLIESSRKDLLVGISTWLIYSTRVSGAERWGWEYCLDQLHALNLTPKDLRPVMDQYQKSDIKSEWLAAMLLGRHHIDTAWHYRGSGYANKVKEEGWKQFHSHLTEASTAFRKAHQLHPEWPEAATQMITVLGTGHGDDATAKDTPRTWFDKAIAAQCDYWPAYVQMLWTLEPKWGGSHQSMLAFGERCVRTGRYDTEIPYAYVQAALEVGTNTQWKDLLKIYPDLFLKLDHVLIRLADHPSRVGSEGASGEQHARMLTTLACFAVRLNQSEQARDLFEEVGGNIQEDWLEPFSVRRKYDLSRAYAYGHFGEELHRARPLTLRPRNERKDSVRLRNAYEELLEQNKGSQAVLYLNTWAEKGRLEVKYHDGDWVDLKFDEDLALWSPTHSGTWKYEDEHSILGMDTGPWNKNISLYHTCEFPGPKEMTVEVELVEKQTFYRIFAGLYLGQVFYLNSSPSDGRLFFVEPEGKLAGIGAFNKRAPMIPLEFRPSKLHVKVWGPHHFEFYINGRRFSVITKDEEFQLSSNLVGIGTMFWFSDTAQVRFRNLRVRKLTQPEPPEESDENRPKLVEYYTAALQQDPEIWDYYVQRGIAYSRLEKYPEAALDLKQALQKMPEHRPARTHLGQVQCELREYAAGMKNLQQAAEPGGHPFNQAMYAYFLATAPEDKLRDGQKALKLIEAVMKPLKDPSSDLLEILAVAQAETGNFDGALTTAKKLLTMVKLAKDRQRAKDLLANLERKQPWRHKATQ